MAIKYLAAKRIRGSSTGVPVAPFMNIDSSPGSNNRVTHDLTSIDSDEWTLRFRYSVTGGSGSAGGVLQIGITSTPS